MIEPSNEEQALWSDVTRDYVHDLNNEIEKLRDLLRDVLPFTATFSVGCHGEKCRNQWCHSCYDKYDADAAAMRGLHAYQNGRKALEQST